MTFSIVFVLVFIIGFVLGLAMPFILFKYPFKIVNKTISEKEEPSSTANEILDEWLNGKGGE